MTDYVKNSKKALNLEKLKLQNQLDTLKNIETMSDESKLEYLFSNLDRDDDGRIDVSELSDGLRRINANMGFQEGLEQAVLDVAMNDTNDDAKLDLEEFKSFIQKIINKSSGLQSVIEFIIMQIIFSDGGNTSDEKKALEIRGKEINKKVKDIKNFNDTYDDPNMVELFNLFDTDGNMTIDFKEIARGLYKIKHSISESLSSTMDLMLMIDKNDERRLTYDQFVRLILNFCALSGEDFNDVAPIFVANIHTTADDDEIDFEALVSAEDGYYEYQDLTRELEEAGEVVDLLKCEKLSKLFDLWDTNKNGLISWTELALGCRKFQKSKDICIDGTTMLSYFAIEDFDENKDKQLDKMEFAKFLISYAKESKKDLHELIDTLAIISLLEDNSEEEERYIKTLASKKVEVGNSTSSNNVATHSSISFKLFESNDRKEIWI